MATATSETMATADPDAENFAALKVNDEGVEAVRAIDYSKTNQQCSVCVCVCV